MIEHEPPTMLKASAIFTVTGSQLLGFVTAILPETAHPLSVTVMVFVSVLEPPPSTGEV